MADFEELIKGGSGLFQYSIALLEFRLSDYTD